MVRKSIRHDLLPRFFFACLACALGTGYGCSFFFFSRIHVGTALLGLSFFYINFFLISIYVCFRLLRSRARFISANGREGNVHPCSTGDEILSDGRCSLQANGTKRYMAGKIRVIVPSRGLTPLFILVFSYTGHRAKAWSGMRDASLPSPMYVPRGAGDCMYYLCMRMWFLCDVVMRAMIVAMLVSDSVVRSVSNVCVSLYLCACAMRGMWYS